MSKGPKRRKVKIRKNLRGVGKLGYTESSRMKNTLSKIEKATDLEKEAITPVDVVADCKRETGGYL